MAAKMLKSKWGEEARGQQQEDVLNGNGSDQPSNGHSNDPPLASPHQSGPSLNPPTPCPDCKELRKEVREMRNSLQVLIAQFTNFTGRWNESQALNNQPISQHNTTSDTNNENNNNNNTDSTTIANNNNKKNGTTNAEPVNKKPRTSPPSSLSSLGTTSEWTNKVESAGEIVSTGNGGNRSSSPSGDSHRAKLSSPDSPSSTEFDSAAVPRHRKRKQSLPLPVYSSSTAAPIINRALERRSIGVAPSDLSSALLHHNSAASQLTATPAHPLLPTQPAVEPNKVLCPTPTTGVSSYLPGLLQSQMLKNAAAAAASGNHHPTNHQHGAGAGGGASTPSTSNGLSPWQIHNLLLNWHSLPKLSTSPNPLLNNLHSSPLFNHHHQQHHHSTNSIPFPNLVSPRGVMEGSGGGIKRSPLVFQNGLDAAINNNNNNHNNNGTGGLLTGGLLTGGLMGNGAIGGLKKDLLGASTALAGGGGDREQATSTSSSRKCSPMKLEQEQQQQQATSSSGSTVFNNTTNTTPSTPNLNLHLHQHHCSTPNLIHDNTTAKKKPGPDDFIKEFVEHPEIKEDDARDGPETGQNDIIIPVPEALIADPEFRAASEEEILGSSRWEELEWQEAVTRLAKKLAERRVFGPQLMAKATVAGTNHSNYPNLPMEGILYIESVCRRTLFPQLSRLEFAEFFRPAVKGLAARCRRIRHSMKPSPSSTALDVAHDLLSLAHSLPQSTTNNNNAITTSNNNINQQQQQHSAAAAAIAAITTNNNLIHHNQHHQQQQQSPPTSS